MTGGSRTWENGFNNAGETRYKGKTEELGVGKQDLEERGGKLSGALDEEGTGELGVGKRKIRERGHCRTFFVKKCLTTEE